MPVDTTLYDQLGVSPNATTEEIVNAGRKLSRKWHPDKNKDNKEEAETKFKEIRNAIDILSNEEKRRNYDNFGLNSEQDEIHSNMPDMANIFNIFSNFSNIHNIHNIHNNMANMNINKTRYEPIIHNLYCTLEQIAKEENVSINYKQQVICEKCDGEGGTDYKTCDSCKGQGKCLQVIQIGPMQHQTITQCKKCTGIGKIINKVCKECNGQTFVTKNKKESIKLKKGLENGMKLNIKNKGNQYKSDKTVICTELIIIVNIESHDAFKRKGPNLFVEIELSLYEALFGFTRLIHHLDGRILHVKYKGKTDYGTYRKLKGEGLPDLKNNNIYGNLYIHFTFLLPNISEISEIKKDEKDEKDEKNDNQNWKEVNVKLFANGGIQMTGVTSETFAKNAMDWLLNKFLSLPESPFSGEPTIQRFSVQLINTDYAISKFINQDALHKILINDYNMVSMLEKTIYQGVNTKFFYNTNNNHSGICRCNRLCKGQGTGDGDGECKRITMSIFRTGRIIITGARELTQIRSAYQFLNSIFDQHHAKILYEPNTI